MHETRNAVVADSLTTKNDDKLGSSVVVPAARRFTMRRVLS